MRMPTSGHSASASSRFIASPMHEAGITSPGTLKLIQSKAESQLVNCAGSLTPYTLESTHHTCDEPKRCLRACSRESERPAVGARARVRGHM